jgi:hypothetical protein
MRVVSEDPNGRVIHQANEFLRVVGRLWFHINGVEYLAGHKVKGRGPSALADGVFTIRRLRRRLAESKCQPSSCLIHY